MRRQSKADKAAGYDRLASHAGRMELVLHDIACGVAPDTTAKGLADSDTGDEQVVAEAGLYRVHSGDAGLVLLRVFTRYADGSPDSSSDTRVVRLDDMNELAGGEDYWRTPYGKAVFEVAQELRAFRRRAYGMDDKS